MAQALMSVFFFKTPALGIERLHAVRHKIIERRIHAAVVVLEKRYSHEDKGEESL